MVHFLIKGLTKKGKEFPVKDSVFSILLKVRVQKETINTRELALSDFGLTKSGARSKMECSDIVAAVQVGVCHLISTIA
jgi:hypothetical protein